eukprot:scaffold798_cov367-Pavlova_lutheri.AAC.4
MRTRSFHLVFRPTVLWLGSLRCPWRASAARLPFASRFGSLRIPDGCFHVIPWPSIRSQPCACAFHVGLHRRDPGMRVSNATSNDEESVGKPQGSSLRCRAGTARPRGSGPPSRGKRTAGKGEFLLSQGSRGDGQGGSKDEGIETPLPVVGEPLGPREEGEFLLPRPRWGWIRGVPSEALVWGMDLAMSEEWMAPWEMNHTCPNKHNECKRRWTCAWADEGADERIHGWTDEGRKVHMNGGRKVYTDG